jgi:hypothetical protein
LFVEKTSTPSRKSSMSIIAEVGIYLLCILFHLQKKGKKFLIHHPTAYIPTMHRIWIPSSSHVKIPQCIKWKW